MGGIIKPFFFENQLGVSSSLKNNCCVLQHEIKGTIRTIAAQAIENLLKYWVDRVGYYIKPAVVVT